MTNSEVLDGVLLGRVSLENVNWNMGVRKMTDSGGLSWEAQEVFQKMKSFNRLPGAGIPMIQLNMKVGSAFANWRSPEHWVQCAISTPYPPVRAPGQSLARMEGR